MMGASLNLQISFIFYVSGFQVVSMIVFNCSDMKFFVFSHIGKIAGKEWKNMTEVQQAPY